MVALLDVKKAVYLVDMKDVKKVAVRVDWMVS